MSEAEIRRALGLSDDTVVAFIDANSQPVMSAVTITEDIIRQIREKGVPFGGGLVAELTLPINPVSADDLIIFANPE